MTTNGAQIPVGGPPPTRPAIEALLSTLVHGRPFPRWATHPETKTQFAASLIAHVPAVTPVYNERDELIMYRGIALKGTTPSAGRLRGAP